MWVWREGRWVRDERALDLRRWLDALQRQMAPEDDAAALCAVLAVLLTLLVL